MFENYPDVMMVEDVANALNVCNATVYKLIHSKDIRYFTVGREYRIPKKALIAFIDLGGVTIEAVSS